MLLALVAVLALTATVASIEHMLHERLRQSTVTTRVALGQLQALYLAEMGINQLMAQANRNPGGTFPGGTDQDLDFKPDVAMVRDEGEGVARCLVGRTASDAPQGSPPYAARATLVTPDGTFSRTVFFDVGRAAVPPAGQAGPQWVLVRVVPGS